jgi:HEPN domain-containing protein
VTADELARAYVIKASKRRRVLEVLLEEEAYSDVVREAQELVELALKGMLRCVGIDPPKWHDVGPILKEQRDFFPEWIKGHIGQLADISRWLRKEREFAFYGDVDFIPTEEYTRKDAERAIQDALFVLDKAQRLLETN